MEFSELIERIENLRDRYNFHEKERLLDDIAKSFDDRKINYQQAVDMYTQIFQITLKAFD